MYRFTIKDVENLSGVKAHTIRVWEKRYNILMPQRTNTNIRFYTADELKILLDVCLLNKYGYKISAITKFGSEHLETAIAGLKQQAQDEHIINMLFVLLAKLDVIGFEKILNAYSKLNGKTTAITNVIAPFLQKMNLLHFDKAENIKAAKTFYNVIRQKIIAGIIQQNNLPNNNNSILVFLPEDHYNETELLYMQFLMQQQDLHVVYLGANVPLNDVLEIALDKNPDYIYTQLHDELAQRKAAKYLDKLSALLHQFKVVIHLKQQYDKSAPSNIQLTYSAAETLKYISTKTP